MNNPVARVLLAIAIPSFFLIGCYTQFAVQDEPRDDYSSRDQDRSAYTDTTDTGEGDDYDGARRRFYYEYYPSVAIGFGFGSWYLDPWYYDPWYYGAWPGPYYYGGWYRPWYHSAYWYTPVWGGGHYLPHSGYRGTTRTFGNSRMIGTGRGGVGTGRVGSGYGTDIYRSRGARSGGGGSGTGYRTQGKPSTGQPSSSPRTSTGRRGRDGERMTSPPARQKPEYIPPGRSSSGRDRERSRGNEYRAPQPAPRHESSGRAPSYSPPSSGQSAPSSSGGGSRTGGGGGGGSRGGNRR